MARFYGKLLRILNRERCAFHQTSNANPIEEAKAMPNSCMMFYSFDKVQGFKVLRMVSWLHLYRFLDSGKQALKGKLDLCKGFCTQKRAQIID
jgi:hypothetical protein